MHISPLKSRDRVIMVDVPRMVASKTLADLSSQTSLVTQMLIRIVNRLNKGKKLIRQEDPGLLIVNYNQA